ncbi:MULTISPECIES: GNAT family N-acetyltransferase [Streptomyces]|uniref:GNAT family N-acetyltransferase n=1 Tax=Streptomyces mutomycini TaxID=284036 RepID=A0ABW0B012_9ACTN|nr:MULTISPECIES: GNAT family N-acetyltransferase [Streptomyces]KPC84911.1 GCN5 family acetyltransferase [Streptomyces sp. NRRL S-4]
MKLRPGRPHEAAALTALALRSKAHWGYDAAFLAACRDELTVRAGDMEDGRTVVAEEDGGLLGFAALSGEPPEGALGMMFVEPDAIGRGVGRLLFEHAVGQARRLGFAALTIDADPNAEPFYTAMGAVRIGATPSGSIPGRELPLLRIEFGAQPG